MFDGREAHSHTGAEMARIDRASAVRSPLGGAAFELLPVPAVCVA